MKIFRDGKEYKLTMDELRHAYLLWMYIHYEAVVQDILEGFHDSVPEDNKNDKSISQMYKELTQGDTDKEESLLSDLTFYAVESKEFEGISDDEIDAIVMNVHWHLKDKIEILKNKEKRRN